MPVSPTLSPSCLLIQLYTASLPSGEDLSTCIIPLLYTHHLYGILFKLQLAFWSQLTCLSVLGGCSPCAAATPLLFSVQCFSLSFCQCYVPNLSTKTPVEYNLIIHNAGTLVWSNLEIKLFVVSHHCIGLLSKFFLLPTFQDQMLLRQSWRWTSTLGYRVM